MDGTTDVAAILASSELGRLETCCVLSQLQRAHEVTIGGTKSPSEELDNAPQVESSVELNT